MSVSIPPGFEERVEHALLDPAATHADIQTLCTRARDNKLRGVLVYTSRVPQAYTLLEETSVKVIAAIGFPHGAMDADAKRYETEMAVDLNAHEIEVVLNIGRLKEGDHNYVLRELRDICEAADERLVKVVIETPLLNNEEKITACHLVVDSGARFVVTSSGLYQAKASIEDIRLVREVVGQRFGVKAAGSIKDMAEALALIEGGSDRVGTGHVGHLLPTG